MNTLDVGTRSGGGLCLILGVNLISEFGNTRPSDPYSDGLSCKSVTERFPTVVFWFTAGE